MKHVLAILALVALTSGVGAAPQCAPLKDIDRMLTDGPAKELAMVQGVSGDGGLFRLYGHPSKRTWTAVTITPDGKTGCMVLAGDGLERARVRRGGRGDL